MKNFSGSALLSIQGKGLFALIALFLLCAARQFEAYEGELAASKPFSSPPIDLQVGQKAPAFTLPGPNETSISLADFQGSQHVLLVFYRGSWCPYCVSHLEDVQNLFPVLRRYNVQLLAISPQSDKKSIELNERFQTPYVFLADRDLAVAGSYGIKKNRKLPHPAVFLIGKDGNLLWYHVDQDFKRRPSAVQLKKVLQTLLVEDSTAGREGDDTLSRELD